MDGENPNITALQEEYRQAWNNERTEDGKLGFVESVRYCRWAGQALDGLQHADHYEEAGREPVWEGFPDCRIPLADDICNYLVALFVISFWNSQVKTSPIIGKTLNAQQAGELRTLLNWLKNGPMKTMLIQNIEIAAQLTAMVGWCVLHPGWKRLKWTGQVKVTMDQVKALANQFRQKAGATPQGLMSLLAVSPEVVADPAMEDEAAEMFQLFFPDISKTDARQHVKTLREKGETEFPQERNSSVRPELGVLCPWYHFIMPIEGTARPEDARLKFIRLLIPKWRVDDWAAAEEWTDKEFIEQLKNTAGDFQQPPRTKEDDRDINKNLCELVYAFRTVVKDGALSFWCTIINPKIGPGKDRKGGYGKNWELNLEGATDPFVFSRLEATDWCVTDTRGVCDVVATMQNEMKNFRDAAFAYTQLNVTPPIQKMGTSASKLPPEFGPFAIINNAGGGPNQWQRLDLTSGTNIEVPFKLQELVRKEAEDYYGIPRGDTPPQKSQLKQQKLVNQWLGNVGNAMDQLLVLAYQNMDPSELRDILGHEPLLDAATVARHKVLVSYDVRTGDPEFIKSLKDTLTAIMSAGLGNDLLLNKVVSYWLNFVDPNAAQEFMPQDNSAGRQAVKDARDELNNVMFGNKPMLVEKDPAAKTKLQAVQQLMQQNPKYQRVVMEKINGQANPEYDPNVAENFKTMMDNWQHSYQETVLSKAQGRLGVKDVGPQ